MKSILVGNGFNLQIDRQHALSNRNILLRVEQNLLNKDYTGIFENTITCEELRPLLRGLASLLPEVLSGEFDNYVTDDNEKKTLEQFRRQYTKSSNQYDIGMEDYFFLMRMEQKRAGDDGPQAFFHAANGMKWIFLDAIYNEGKSQHLTDNLKKRDFYRIRDAIENNDRLDIIRFFYHSDADKEAAERFDDKRILKVPAEQFWNRRHS